MSEPVVFQAMSDTASENFGATETPASPESPPPQRAVSTTVLVLFLGALGSVLAAYFFVIFCVTRGLLRGIGFDVSTTIQCLLVTLVMAGFVVWLAPLCHLPEALLLHRRSQRRAARGLCPACGHPRQAAAEPTAPCPECGSDAIPPRPFEFGWPSIRRFALVGGAAYVVGSLLGFTLIRADEARFAHECSIRGGAAFERPRAWPASFCRLSFDGESATSSSVEEELFAPARPSRR